MIYSINIIKINLNQVAGNIFDDTFYQNIKDYENRITIIF